MKGNKRMLWLAFGAVIFAAALFLPEAGKCWRLLAFSAAYLILGADILYKSLRNLLRGEVFDENFLMSIATLGAFAIGQYSEGVAVMLFYQIGGIFESYAVNKSRKSISALSAIRPDYATLKENDTLRRVEPASVPVGAIIVVKPGERLALDGIVVAGESLLDTSALTGESVPRRAAVGMNVLSGSVNVNGLLEIQTASVYAQSTVAKILDLVENASDKKAKTESFITRFARYYTPAVVALALLVAILPPLFAGASWNAWIYRALIFLVISCPCALVISIPLGFFGGIGGASRRGILIKGGNYLEALSRAETAVFDKTGTLTKAVFEVVKIETQGMDKKALLEIAAYAEAHSTHPIAAALRKAYAEEIVLSRVTEVEEMAGLGVRAVWDGKAVLAGSKRLLERAGLTVPDVQTAGSVVYLALNGQYAGFVVIADQLKPEALKVAPALEKLGIQQTVILSGDKEAVAQETARVLGFSRYAAELLPADKVTEIEKLLAGKHAGRTLLFTGDGINDAPVLARADVGIAMGGVGSDAAVEAADVVLMDDNPLKVAEAVDMSRYTMKIVKQNIIFALGVKTLVMLLGVFGVATMWEAVFADVGVTVLAVLNAIRPLRYAPRNQEVYK